MRRRLHNVVTSITSRVGKPHDDGRGARHLSHGHSHSHGHGHSHTLEDTVQGKQLRLCQIATAVGGATNIFFSTTKIWFGLSGGSVALVADGFHALVDLLADVVSYMALTVSTKRLPRCRFPFGIGRTETAGAVIVASMLLFGAVTLLFTSMQECTRELLKLINPNGESSAASTGAHSHNEHIPNHHQHHGNAMGGHPHEHAHHSHSHYQVAQTDEMGRVTIMWTMVALAAASVVCKEALFRWTKRVGERAGSRVVVANAYHHRADAWSGAIALVGVAGQCIGMPGIDGLAGLFVSASICQIGYALMRDSVLEFFDFQRAEEVAAVRRVLQDYNKLHLVNVFLIRHGHSYALHVTLLTEMDTAAMVLARTSNELTKLAQRSVRVADTFTTIAPCDRGSEESLSNILRLVEEFHGLQSIPFDWGTRRISLPQTIDEECMRDVKSIAAFFELEIDIVAGENDFKGTAHPSVGCC